MNKLGWLLVLLSTCSYASTDVNKMSENDKAAYAIGITFGNYLLRTTSTMTEAPESSVTLDNEQILRGIRDSLNEESLLSDEELEVTLKTVSQKVNGSPQDTESEFTDKMATYATIAGRATACGIDVASETEVVGKWMEKEFNRLNISNKMRSTYQLTFAEGMKHHMQEQLAGNSPDTCQNVESTLNGFPWPY